jgi:hypothetical protein
VSVNDEMRDRFIAGFVMIAAIVFAAWIVFLLHS